MINLLALTLSGILMTGAFIDAGFESTQDAHQKERDEASERRKASGLLLNASSIEIEFVGNRFFSSSTLLEQMKRTRDCDLSDCPALCAPGSLELLMDDLERVRYFLGTVGFITAKVGKPKIEDLGEMLKVTVGIEEGLRYRIGKISVNGAKVFTSERIIEISGLRTGEFINARILSENVYKGIKNIYSDQGHIQADVDIIPDFRQVYPGAPEGIVDVKLDIDEGKAFFIEAIDFLGLAETNDQSLRDLLLIRKGDLFNRRMFVETLKSLNQLGLFEEILEKDVITKTNDKERQVSLTIQVKEIKRQ